MINLLLQRKFDRNSCCNELCSALGKPNFPEAAAPDSLDKVSFLSSNALLYL
jgi:hypothetical protein